MQKKRAISLRKLEVIILILLFSMIICHAFIQTTKSALTPITVTTTSPENVTVYFLDVGQGDSILVKTTSKNILIDGGPTDAGSSVVEYLNTYQISKIDLMVATHPHADHIGGLIAVLQSGIPVQDIIYNGYNYTSTQTFNTWKTLALAHNLTQGNGGQIYAVSPTINFTVLSPASPTQFSDLNAESIVMRLQVGNTSVMLTGDAQFDTEQFLMSSGANLSSQILKVGHHGSNTSTSQAFLNAVAPTFAVISAGLDNPYGHPTQQTLNILASNKIVTYCTIYNGTVVFSLNSAASNTSVTPAPSPTPTASSSLTPSPSPSLTLSPTPSPSPSATPSPSPTVTVSPNPTATANPSLTPTPSIPELPAWAILPLLMVVTVFAAAVNRKRSWQAPLES